MSPALAKAGVHGPGVDEPIVVYEGSGTANKSWMMADHQGSIIGYTNGNGAVTNINTYSMEGVPGDNNVGRFGYTGQMWLEGAELYHYKARAYDPQLGRFLQTDPIGYGDGLNMYAYVGGDAMNGRDPSGTSRIRNRSRPTDCPEGTPQGDSCGQRGGGRRSSSIYITINPFGGLGPLGTSGTGLQWGFGPEAGLLLAEVGSKDTVRCTAVQQMASEYLRGQNDNSVRWNREIANAIYSVDGGPLKLTLVSGVGPVCGEIGCEGPDTFFTTAQIPRGASIHGYMHTHGASLPTYLSVNDVRIGEPTAFGNPFNSITPGAVQTYDTTKYEGLFFIDRSGVVQQYTPGTLPGGTPLTSEAAAASSPIDC